VPLWLFWGLLIVWLFPWSVFLPGALREAFCAFLKNVRGDKGKKELALILVSTWAVVILVFFSFSTRQEYYLIPALPALAVLIGVWLAQEVAEAPPAFNQRLGKWGSTVLLILGVAGFVIALGLVLTVPELPPGTDLSDVLSGDPALYARSMGHATDLTVAAMAAFRLPLVLAGCALLAGGVGAWWFRRRAVPDRGNYALVAMMVVILYAVHLSLGVFAPILGSKSLAAVIQREYRPGDLVVVDGEYSQASSIAFYTGIALHVLTGRVNHLWYGSLFPDAPDVFEDEASLARLWSGPRRVFLITLSSAGAEKVRRSYPLHHELAREGTKRLFSNQSSPGSMPGAPTPAPTPADSGHVRP